MKKLQLLSLLFFLLVFSNVKAQYVTIPDQGMVTWLTNNYPSAMINDQMDTTDLGIVLEDSVTINSSVYIQNLDGIQYFDNLVSFRCSGYSKDTIPAFPPNLTYLMIIHTDINSFPALPNSLLTFICSSNYLTTLPVLPNSLSHLDCRENLLTSLPLLPNSLDTLYCGMNSISSLPNIPNSAINLDVSHNLISALPILPSSLEIMWCSGNMLTSLPALPANLKILGCGGNLLTSLPVLPASLKILACDANSLTNLPVLPNSLEELWCRENSLTNLPVLPNSLKELFCSDNSLINLPTLPSSLISLECEGNLIVNLPSLPSTLLTLIVSNNLSLTCLPMLPINLLQLAIDSTLITCMPNQPINCYIYPTSLPFCQPNNPNGCISSGSISGALFDNASNTCVNSANLTTNISFHLFDNQNNFLESRSSSINDNYYFGVQAGNYKVRMDSSFFTTSVAVNCPISGEHVVSAVQDSSYTNRDFGVACLGVDVGVEAIVQEGIVFPGQPHSVNTILGDLSQYLGLNCASGTGGTVQINVTGPISYTGYPTTALAPIVNGNSYSYSITDFGAISLDESFVLNFLTDTTAQAGNSITVTATITSDSLDLDSTNNSLSYTYFVVNSYDPNMKEVNPVNVLPGYEDYFTYTVHFQNLGNAPAFNIRIKDTIDGNLDFSTFRVINASHNYSYNLSGELLTVYFPNIMLADSASNPEGSTGFIQYQVKPKPNLPLGTVIENTAHIYFDFNPAIVTNTTTNTYVETLSLAEKDQEEFFVYPNPSSGQFTIVGQNIKNELVKVQVFDLTGKVWKSENLNFKNGSASLQTDLASGSYILILETASGRTNAHRLMIRN